jgi:pimeloyl-ACP methyl ester carboxylesterase
VVGQSLGAVVGTQLALARPVPAFVGLAPAFRPRSGRRLGQMLFLGLRSPRLARASWRWQMEARHGIRTTRERLPELRCPLRVLASADDPTVSPRGGREMVERAGSADKRFLALEGQGHVLSNAPELELVVGPIREWMAGL